MEVTVRKPGTRGFTPITKWWAVERTYGRLMLNRRLARDCETPGGNDLQAFTAAVTPGTGQAVAVFMPVVRICVG